jgi:ferredoxin-NADP reductase
VEAAALPGRLSWQVAKVVHSVAETPRVRSLALDCPSWPGHVAGQHLSIRLTAEDGYQTQRSYSIASAPEDDQLVLTVERLDEGEVSPYLFDIVAPGDEIEVLGPIGGYFVWTGSLDAPVLLIAGGAGVVPFRAILRHHAAARSTAPVRLLYSARSLGDVIYRGELAQFDKTDLVDIQLTLTRDWPNEWTGYRRRVDMEILREVAWPPDRQPLIYVCGPSGFVEAAAGALVSLGHDSSSIKTERFGPTGT